MSDYAIGDMEYEWSLEKRDGQVELWYNDKSGYYGVYLYEHSQQSEDWILHVVRKTEDEAEKIFYTVADMLS